MRGYYEYYSKASQTRFSRREKTMNPIVLRIPIVPRAQKRDRIAVIGGHARSYKDANQRAYEAKIRALIDQHRPKRPHDGEVILDITVFLPIPASWSKKKKRAFEEKGIAPLTRPDVDNCAKQIMDTLNGVFWNDDRQVTHLSVSKFYSTAPGWEIQIQLNEPRPI
jgi:Holliday junction resolvase RusA-like endonuclease